MERVYKNEALLELIKGSYYIHDSIISRFDIYYEDDRLNIDVYFNSINSNSNNSQLLKISFMDVIKYQFLWNEKHHFYTVESYKFFKSETGFYISLDPFDELEEISKNDEDLILCKNIEGKFYVTHERQQV